MDFEAIPIQEIPVLLPAHELRPLHFTIFFIFSKIFINYIKYIKINTIMPNIGERGELVITRPIFN